MVRLFDALALLGTILAVASCVSAPPPIDVQSQCLPLVTYNKPDQAAAAKELASLGPYSELGRFMADYAQMRAADRACLARAGH